MKNIRVILFSVKTMEMDKWNSTMGVMGRSIKVIRQMISQPNDTKTMIINCAKSFLMCCLVMTMSYALPRWTIMDPNFIRGDSNNLPAVDSTMVDEFYLENLQFLSAEIKNVKTERAARSTYGDNAVGYVQVKRTGPLCTVKGRITPEHRVRSKPYHVVADIDEAAEKVVRCECLDCPASSGGCKHGTAFLMWLHRRSEEPSVTSTVCYWRVAPLSYLGKNKEKMGLKDLVQKEIPPLGEKCLPFLEAVKSIESTGGLFSLDAELSAEEIASMHQMMLLYTDATPEEQRTPDDAINFLKNSLTSEVCKSIEMHTRNQSESELWFDLRFGRITASKIYEASRCKTLEGALFETIMGASKALETEPVKRGKRLEKQVLKVIGKKKNLKNIKTPGLFIDPNYPTFGASPDGITEEYCIEIKCPFKEKTVSNYVVEGMIQPRYESQMLLQMFLTGRNQGLFCIASPSFEESEHVDIYEIYFDEEKCRLLIEQALQFWKDAIYPRLC